jgi:hypothetical protein
VVRLENERGLWGYGFYVTRHASLILTILLVGCAIPYVPYRTVYEDPVNYVRLELDDGVLPEWPPTAHAHPAAITSDEVARILNGMIVQEHRIWLQKWIQGEAPFEAVFFQTEVALLSQQLAEALAIAKPNERVTFYLSQPQTSVKRLVTSGGLYVHGTELHFILGNWQIVYGIPTYGMIYDRRYPMRPTAPKGFNLYFQPSDAVVRYRHSLWDILVANTTDELVIDLAKLPSRVASSAAP